MPRTKKSKKRKKSNRAGEQALLAESAPAVDPSDHVLSQTIDQLQHFWLDCGLPEDAWPEALLSYRRYWRLIQAGGAAGRLMGNVSAKEFYLKHVADSLAVVRACPDLFSGPVRLADVGCGAGLPGMILAVALPQLRLTAIESNRKKAAFIASAAEELQLARRVEVVPRRSRELGQDEEFRRRFDLVTARAVAPADKLIRDCRLLIAPGGCAIFYKTPAAIAAELPAAGREAAKHKLAMETSEIIALPARAGTRQFIRVIAPA